MNYSSESNFKALIYERELDRIAGWVEEYPQLETGGDLFGFWTHSGAPVVQFVLGPAPDSIHNGASFYQGRDFLIRAGEVLRSKHGLQHIGEWHSHHQLGLAEPSGGDAQTVIRALEKYEFPRFLLCIANLRPKKEWGSQWEVNVGGFLFTRHRPRYEVGSWVLLPGESPIREGLRSSVQERFLNDPKLRQDWKVKKTSLDAEVLMTTEPAKVSDTVWYASQDGKELLKSLYDRFTKEFEHCEMRRTQSEEVYFTFQKGRETWEFKLPNDFPQSPFLIYESRSKRKFNGSTLRSGRDLFDAIERFFSDFYKERV
jgi:hypothetical protein